MPPKKHLAMSVDTLDCHNWHLVGRGQGSAKRPPMYKTTPRTKNYPVSRVQVLRLTDGSGARVELCLCQPLKNTLFSP